MHDGRFTPETGDPESGESPPRASHEGAGDGGRVGPDWEDPRAEGGRVATFFRTARAVLFEPLPTFRGMKRSPSIGAPLLYWLRGVLSSLGDFPTTDGTATVGPVAAVACVSVCAAPVFFVTVGYYHLVLAVFGVARHGFAATFRTLSYVNGSLSLVSWIPCLGPIAALLYGPYLIVVGFREAHGSTTGRVTLAFIVAMIGPVILIGGTLIYLALAGSGLTDKIPIPMV